MDISEVREFIEKQSWIFAKTYANKAPHEYVVRGRINGTDEEFLSVVNFIQDNGITILLLGKGRIENNVRNINATDTNAVRR